MRRRSLASYRGWIGSTVLVGSLSPRHRAGGLETRRHREVRGGRGEPARADGGGDTGRRAEQRQHRQTTTAIGTVLALRSITLRNELPARCGGSR